jgi:hypothetical protein
MTMCCGIECATPFCPMCGERASELKLFSLLKHLKRVREGFKSRLNRQRCYLEKQRASTRSTSEIDDTLSIIESAEASYAKWDDWVEALVAAMGKRENAQCQSAKTQRKSTT